MAFLWEPTSPPIGGGPGAAREHDRLMIRFGPYRLDPVQGLKRGKQEIRLTPKSLAVLAVLAGQPGRVVTKDEFFTTVWQDTAVTDAALATCIQEIRRALGDRSRDARFIETVHRRGYRFVAQTSDAPSPGPIEPPRIPSDRRPCRSRAGARLPARRLRSGSAGRPPVLPDHGRARDREERHPGGGARPARESRSRRRDVGQLRRAVRQRRTLPAAARRPHAPRAGVRTAIGRSQSSNGMRRCGSPNSRVSSHLTRQLPCSSGSSGRFRDRMLRELTNAVEVLARQSTLVLAIEDLHWSDPSTLDWILSVAPRIDRANLPRDRHPATGQRRRGGRPSGALLRESLRARRLAREIVAQRADD